MQGIAWCGACGHKITMQYKGGVRYICNTLHNTQNAPICQHLPARPIDERVTAAFLDAVAPAELEAWERAQTARRQAAATLDRAEAQQVERLRYQAILAERQFNRVDPDNRLVASELERRWELALRELRQAEEALARRRASTYEPPSLTPRNTSSSRASPRAAGTLASARRDAGLQKGARVNDFETAGFRI